MDVKNVKLFILKLFQIFLLLNGTVQLIKIKLDECAVAYVQKRFINENSFCQLLSTNLVLFFLWFNNSKVAFFAEIKATNLFKESLAGPSNAFIVIVSSHSSNHDFIN